MRWFARYAWLGHLATDVVVETSEDRISSVTEGVASPPEATLLEGLVLPGLVNAHSHAFHRGLRGLAEGEDFWEWRDEMYRMAAVLDPDSYYLMARATFSEMALAGITSVGEFHYLHHAPRGRRYADPNEMSKALLGAAEAAGIRITLIDTCYLRGDFDRPLSETQQRFSDGSAEAWTERTGLLSDSDTVRLGAGIHSVRAVDQASISAVALWAKENGRRLHVHVSEQRAENERCLEATGMTPTALLADCGAWEAGGTAVHGTHVTEADIELLGSSAVGVCVCPTTERDLADGVTPAAELANAGAVLSVGSDSNAYIDLLEEARLLDLHLRLVTGTRQVIRADRLAEAATWGGARALGWDAGKLEAGYLADFVSIRLDTPRTAGPGGGHLERILFGASASDVDSVVVGGRVVVEGGAHQLVDDVPGLLAEATSLIRARM